MPAASLNTVVKLGIPDLLGGGPMRAEQLAQKAGVDEDRLYRIMRALTTLAGEIRVVFPVHPRTRTRIQAMGGPLSAPRAPP